MSSSAAAASIDTWHSRLKAVIGPHGYDSCMRRSLQTCILYEAKRIVSPQLEMLKPFQRKFAFMDQAKALLQTIDFVPVHERDEIFYRTKCSMEMFKPDVAWKRAQTVDKELETLAELIKPLHGLAAWALCGLVVLHLAAALKHQFINRDGLLQRMWFAKS